MKKSTKGALAAGSAMVLLTGAAGTLAYWTDEKSAEGTTIGAGHLKLGDPSCVGWTLDDDAAYLAQKLVPGDELTQVCTFNVDTDGDHLAATFDVSTPSLTGGAPLIEELDVNASYEVNDVAATVPAEIVDGDVITATIVVTWDYGVEDNDSNVVPGLQAVLDDITVTATQTHP